MNKNEYQMLLNGDAAFTILFEQPVSEKLTRQLLWLAKNITEKFQLGITDIVPAYQSLTVIFLPLTIDLDEIQQYLVKLLQTELPQISTVGNIIEIPVCYDASLAPDLNWVAEHCRISTAELVKQHCADTYLVHMLGFSPGFLYLGGLAENLFCPRKSIPRKRVAAGSVGIGGQQTGIYPQATPGGWQIIGRTPLALFAPDRTPPFIARALDRIKFKSISLDRFNQLNQLEPTR